MAKSAIDLNALSAAELIELIKEAEAVLATKREGARTELVEEIKVKAAALGLSLNDLLGRPRPHTNVRRPRSDAGKTVVAKYRGPNGAEWTGRGRKPRWLAELEAEGKTKEEFAL
ncbi:H-NS family nucleoid-associated regulatory protein [Pararoseomonas indoligenes]|uniref:H-NS histone family protein n=1 Tax=Roseomonas indoligenes TaxID=2820811 RepID=A0A940N3E6_9PROT|nr:H-NS histone family protein [Pararoseomonas indoligenes]MBP0496508.1 H-NS histone family protein [Pararoseomonas indoligenes]